MGPLSRSISCALAFIAVAAPCLRAAEADREVALWALRMGGWVTLEGSVTYIADKHYAEQAVRKLFGVQGVLNKIVVSAPK